MAQVCVVGGGPAGMMTALLLSRVGIKTVVLEKHRDFLRDFRGDTIHPSTLQVLDKLGLLDEFLERPHQKVERLSGFVGETATTMADFSHLNTKAPFIVLMPQWEFLDFLKEKASQYPSFSLNMNSEFKGLVRKGSKVLGVTAEGPEGDFEVRCELVIGADGRHSKVRELAGLKVKDLGAPMDVFWMELSRESSDYNQPFARFDRGKIFVMLYRDSYWQCGYVIPKGRADEIRNGSLDSFRKEMTEISPLPERRFNEIRSWDQIKLLSVRVDRLETWYQEGLLCIGDAAHAMSPIGGVGINLAIQDAVATSNILAPRLLEGKVSIFDLRAVQRRRSLPTRVTQWAQVMLQNRVIRPFLANQVRRPTPFLIKLLNRFPILRRVPAYLIGVGVRPEIPA